MGSYEITGEEMEGRSENKKWEICKKLLQTGGITATTAAISYEILTGEITDKAAEFVSSNYSAEALEYSYEVSSSLGL